jgi:LacI family transcriptional regulator
LDNAGYVAFLANTGESLDRQERFLKRMREQNVDGVVLCAVAGTPKSMLRQLDDWKMPCVQTLRSISYDEGDYVGSDYQLGLEQVTEHLIRLGHKRIALVGGDRMHSAMLERRAGFISAMQRHRLSEELILSTPPTRQAGLDAVGILLDRSDPPTAAVCFNDTVAFGLMVGLQRRGLQPGRDFAVTGVDDVPEAAISFPSLTTVATLPRRLGEAAAELLLQRIENPNGTHERTVLPTRLLVRESSGGYLQNR